VRGAPKKNNCEWKRTEVQENWPVLYIAPFRSAIRHHMLVLWFASTRMIVFAEYASSCNPGNRRKSPLSASVDKSGEVRNRTLEGFPDARRKEITLPRLSRSTPQPCVGRTGLVRSSIRPTLVPLPLTCSANNTLCYSRTTIRNHANGSTTPRPSSSRAVSRSSERSTVQPACLAAQMISASRNEKLCNR
jgi:hypothetical protein